MWSFEGNGTSVTISYDETGAFKIFGYLRTHYHIPWASHDFEFLDVIRDARLPFAVVSSEAKELGVISTFDKPNLFDRFRQKPTHSLAMVNYWPKDSASPSMLYLTVILSQQAEQRILDMYKVIFGRSDLYHLITVGFRELVRIPDNATVEVPPDVLTVAEFLHPDLLSRKSHFSNEITFSLHTAPRLPPL